MMIVQCRMCHSELTFSFLHKHIEMPIGSIQSLMKTICFLHKHIEMPIGSIQSLMKTIHTRVTYRVLLGYYSHFLHVCATWHTAFPSHVAYITILGIPGWVPTEYEWPESWTSFQLGCDPTLQVWLWERRRQAIGSHIWRVSRLDWEVYMYLAGHGHHTHPTMLG